ncbi:MAG: hypothetical protein HY897_12120 [Deltaproteobacteria bacterium]|nr:hypothetical protein [Deltaproteobacteria bacterium]
MDRNSIAATALGIALGIALAACSGDEAIDAGTGGNVSDAGTDAGTDAGGPAFCPDDGTCSEACPCPVGVQCLDNGGMFCWTVCTDDADCTEPAVCTDTTLGFSVCAEEG